MSRVNQPIGLRREVVFFLPTAVFLLVVIASFNLMIYRNAVREFEGAALDRAAAVAARVANHLESGPPLSADRVRSSAPNATGIAIYSQAGRPLSRAGTPSSLAPEVFAQLTPDAPTRLVGVSELGVPVAIAVRGFEGDGPPQFVQIDLPIPRLAAHRASLRRISILNVVALGSISLLVLLFLRHLLAPYESLLARARSLGGDEQQASDEVDFLIGTFERALEALSTDPEQDDIASLERTLAPSLQSGFLLLDPSGAVLSLNRLGAGMLGTVMPQPGISLDDLLPEHGDFLEVVRESIAEERTERRRECTIGAAGNQKVLGLTVHPLRRNDGQVRAFIVLFADLTEVQARARQDRISRNLTQLGEIAAGVAHEMRNGLGTLKGYLTLMENTRDGDSVRDYVSEMRSESVHLERVLSDFLSFARPGSLRSEPLDLAELVERAAADPALAEGRFRVTGTEQPVRLSGDSQLLEKALRNLLRNALEAHQSVGIDAEIEIRLVSNPDRAEIVIEDSGPGLPAEIQETLFQPFVSGRPGGVGLGLALAHRIAGLHEGELDLENRQPLGARAILRLPQVHDPASGDEIVAD